MNSVLLKKWALTERAGGTFDIHTDDARDTRQLILLSLHGPLARHIIELHNRTLNGKKGGAK